MTPTLEQCMIYTEVFRNVKLELVLAFCAGMFMYGLADWLHKRY